MHVSGRYSSVRLKQAVEMRAFVAKKVCDGAPALMAGDFNVNGRASREDGHTDSKEYNDIWGILTDAAKGTWGGWGGGCGLWCGIA